ncbi:MAG TPA: hypothetical protein VFI87_02380, partial [Hyphomicrobiaceae bacterium]|nr:hypothetical protein [Hyphomicrobiaceae bacterium]
MNHASRIAATDFCNKICQFQTHAPQENFWHHGHTLMSPTASGVQFDECRYLRLHRFDERAEP